MSMKKSSDTIGNRTRDLTACSTVPQPTAPPRAPNIKMYLISIGHKDTFCDVSVQILNSMEAESSSPTAGPVRFYGKFCGMYLTALNQTSDSSRRVDY
jgi:hypothetical protein